MTQYGADPTELNCRRVEVGITNRPDGTSEPIFRVEPLSPAAYRNLLRVVINQPPTIEIEGAEP